MKLRTRIAAVLGASALAVGAGMAAAIPATASDTAINDLQDTPAIQSTSNDMSFVDAYGETFVVNVTTTWQRASASEATLRSIVLRPVSMPRGDCLGFFDVSTTSNIGWSNGGNGTLCPEGLLTYSANATATAYAGNVLGQMTLRTPDPGDPFGGGALFATIEFHS